MNALKKPDWIGLVEKLKGQQQSIQSYRFHVHSTKDLINALNEVCKEHGISRSHLINQLIKDFLSTITK